MSTLNPDGKFDGPDDAAERSVTLSRAVELAMRGLSYRAIADELSVNHDTIRRTLNSPEGQRLLREARDEFVTRTGRIMSSLGMVALQTLGQALTSDDVSLRDKMTAASKILDLQHRHAVTIEGIGPGQSVTITDTSDDLDWLHKRAQQVRRSIEVEAREIAPPEIVEPIEVDVVDEPAKPRKVASKR